MVSRFWPWLLSMVAVCSGFSSFPRRLPDTWGFRQSPLATLEQVNWPEPAPPIGQVGGVAVDSNNDVYIFHRADRQWNYDTFNKENKLSASEAAKGPIKKKTIVKLNAEGKVIGTLGAKRFYVPHGLTVDKKGNLYVTDVGLHQVMRFPKDVDTPDLILGEAMVPGNDRDHFCKPTDVAVLDDGSFYVADGYCNSRIMKFSKEGNLLSVIEKSKGKKNTDHYDFLVPHSLALVEGDMICVADREHNRIQCFNEKTGKVLKSFSKPRFGRVFAIAYDSNDKVIHLVNTKVSGEDGSVGFTINMNGDIVDEWQPYPGFGMAHDVAVSPTGEDVYVGEIWPKRVTKFTKT